MWRRLLPPPGALHAHAHARTRSRSQVVHKLQPLALHEWPGAVGKLQGSEEGAHADTLKLSESGRRR